MPSMSLAGGALGASSSDLRPRERSGRTGVLSRLSASSVAKRSKLPRVADQNNSAEMPALVRTVRKELQPVYNLHVRDPHPHEYFAEGILVHNCEFTTDFDKKKAGYSPDRVDALVWAITGSMVNTVAHEGLMEYYRQQNSKIQDRLKNAAPVKTDEKVSLWAPDSISTVHGLSGEKYIKDSDGKIVVKAEDVSPLLRAGLRYFKEENGKG